MRKRREKFMHWRSYIGSAFTIFVAIEKNVGRMHTQISTIRSHPYSNVDGEIDINCIKYKQCVHFCIHTHSQSSAPSADVYIVSSVYVFDVPVNIESTNRHRMHASQYCTHIHTHKNGLCFSVRLYGIARERYQL